MDCFSAQKRLVSEVSRLRQGCEILPTYPLQLRKYAGQLCQSATLDLGDFPLIDMASRRLQRVIIENQDFEVLIKHYDSPVSFFYCDPPYFATENYYKDVGFTAKDHIRLCETLAGIKGKFLISYNDCPEIRELWNRDGIRIESVSRIDNLRQRYEKGAAYGELFISNYDTKERQNMCHQLSFMDDEYTGGIIS